VQKTSKTWRALRLASKTRLSLFDKVDDGRNLQCLVQPDSDESNIGGGEMTAEGGGGKHSVGQPGQVTVDAEGLDRAGEDNVLVPEAARFEEQES
jgi:THO complex subunit 1